MALPTINTTDFTGIIKISADTFRSAQLTQYITDVYENIVREIIGSEATYTIVNNDITQKYTDLFDGVYYYNINDDKNYQTQGLTWSILRMIYFYYVRDNWISTNTGKVRNNNENSVMLTGIENNQVAINRYNNAVSAINRDLKKWFDNYDNFEGTIDSTIDNGGGSYTINSSNTIYLEDGDTVTIDNTDYVISSLVANTSFNITGGTGLTFPNSYFYSPFEAVEFEKLNYIVF